MKDLAGQRFGRLVAIEPTEKRRRKLVVWRCKCDCGREVEVVGSSLTKGNTRSCGCLREEALRRDLVGRRFGKLVVERRAGTDRGAATWECRCDCGSSRVATTYQLTSGNTRSCGCLKRGEVRNDLTGQRFGRLTVVRPIGRRNRCVLWECRCDCGNVTEVTSSLLRSGKTRSCGCLRKGASNAPAAEDLAGRRFGRLEVVGRAGSQAGNALWECRCDCGNTCTVTSQSLKSGNTQSCGCLADERRGVDLAGKRFGKLVAVERTDKRKNGLVVWRCLCDCGRVCERTSAQLRNGKCPSCGQCD